MNAPEFPLWLLLLVAAVAGVLLGFILGLARGTARGRKQIIDKVKQKVIEGSIAADVDRLFRGRAGHSGKH